MDQKTKGAWLVFHTGKLQNITDSRGFEDTYFAGKAGILLSAIAADGEAKLATEHLDALARASNINTRMELPPILEALEQRGLVDRGQGGIRVLGVTSHATLQHTADIFYESGPGSAELAALHLSEVSSARPQHAAAVREELGDLYKLSKTQSAQVVQDSKSIGFVDSQAVDKKTELLFNGNLFKRDSVDKVAAVLDSMSQDEGNRIRQVQEQLTQNACISVEAASAILGPELWSKVSSIGLFYVSVVSNASEEVGYVTKPAAFAKFSDAVVDDAFDLAKMFVSSLTYGMTRSHYARGQIRMIEDLLNALIQGEPVGPVAAIGEDYKILEMKGVVSVYRGSKSGRHGNMMRLLKREIGILALEVIASSDASQHSLSVLPTAAVNRFRGPEQNRERQRKKEVARSPLATNDILFALRTGGRKR